MRLCAILRAALCLLHGPLHTPAPLHMAVTLGQGQLHWQKSLLGQLNSTLIKVRAQNFLLPGAQTRSLAGVFLEAEESIEFSGWYLIVIYNLGNVLRICAI